MRPRASGLARPGTVPVGSRSLASPLAPLAIIGYGLGPIVLVFVQPDIGTALVYTALAATVNAGANITYTLTATNNGPADAATVSVADAHVGGGCGSKMSSPASGPLGRRKAAAI